MMPANDNKSPVEIGQLVLRHSVNTLDGFLQRAEVLTLLEDELTYMRSLEYYEDGQYLEDGML